MRAEQVPAASVDHVPRHPILWQPMPTLRDVRLHDIIGNRDLALRGGLSNPTSYHDIFVPWDGKRCCVIVMAIIVVSDS